MRRENLDWVDSYKNTSARFFKFAEMSLENH